MKRWLLCVCALAFAALSLLLFVALAPPAQAAAPLAPAVTFTPRPSPTPPSSGVFGIRRQVPVTLTVPLSDDPEDVLALPLNLDVRLHVGFKAAPGVTVTIVGAPTPTPALSMAAVLSSTLLSLDDAPDGWDLFLSGNANLYESDSNSANFLCGYGLPTNVAPRVQEIAFAIFYTPADTQRFLTQVSATMAAGDAATVLDEMAERLPTCRRWTETNAAGVQTTWQVSRYSAPPVGDQSVTIGTLADNLQVRYIFFRVGDVFVMMQQAHSALPIEDDLLFQAATIAAERLAAALE